jgi:SOS-response transcriptional repressor LexA
MTDHPVRDQVYGFILEYFTENHYMPTIGEIATAVGKSGTSVRWHLTKLAEEGRLKRIPGRAGGIIIT